MPLNSVKLYSEQGYYDEFNEKLEGILKPDGALSAGLSDTNAPMPDQPIDINTAPTVDPAPTLSQPNEPSEPTKPAGLGNIYTRVPDQPIETDTEDGNFTRGLKAGIDQTQALGGGLKALAGSIFGKDDWVEDGMAYYQEQMAEAEQNAGDVMTIEEIDSVSDFGAWSAYTLGTIVPDLVGMAATMGIGSTVVKESAKAAIKKNAEKLVEKGRDELIERGMEKEAADKIAAEVAEQYAEAKAKQYSLKGGTGAAILYGTGQAASNQFAQTLLDTGEEAPYISLTSGLAQGALNALPAFKVLSDMIPASLRDDTIRVIEEGVNQPWVGEFLKDVATVQGLEGMTEGLQYLIEQEVIAYVNNNFTDNEAIEYFDYIANEKKRSGLINSTAAGFLSGTFTGTGGATVKKVRGGYNEIDPEANVLIIPQGERSSQRREVDVVEDAEFVEIDESESTDVQTLQQRRQFIADTFNKYNSKRSINLEDNPPRPIDPVTGELAVAWNESGALNPETNLPYTREERREAGIALLTDYQVERQSEESRFNEQQEKAIDNSLAQLREQYGDNFDPARVRIQGIEDGGVSVIYDETGMDLSDEPEQESPALSDAEKAEREARREESIKLLTDYQVQRSDDTMTPIDVDQELMGNLPLASRSVPEGNQGYGHDHKWDGDLTDVSTPVQDQLLQVSQKSQTPEAQDPTNTDVVVEPIDQDDIDRVFDRNETLKIGTNDKPKGKSLPTVDEAYGDNADTVTNAVGGVMADLSAQGVPVKFIDAVSGVFVHNQDDIDAPALTGKNSRGISINSELIDGALTDQDQLRELAWTMTHEVYHAADYAFDLSSKDESFGISIVDSDKPRVEMGAVMEEIFDNWERGTPMGKRFDYPFNDFHDQILDPETNNDALAVRMQQEVFAQLGALFHSNPKQLQEFAPKAYNYIKGIRDNNLQTAQAEVQDEQSSSPVTQETSQPSGISGEVRAPPEPRGEQVVQPEPTGSDGEGSAVQERTDTPVARSEQDESGQRQRSDVQQPALAKKLTSAQQKAEGDRLYTKRLAENPYLSEDNRKAFVKGYVDGYNNTRGPAYSPTDNAEVSPEYSEGYYDGNADLRDLIKYNYAVENGQSTQFLTVKQAPSSPAKKTPAKKKPAKKKPTKKTPATKKPAKEKPAKEKPATKNDDNQESVQEASSERTSVIVIPSKKPPKFKKAENYEDTGEYVVTFEDGDRYTLYFDDYDKETGGSPQYESVDGKIPGLDGELMGETKSEAIQTLLDHRQKLIDSDTLSYNVPLDPVVSGDTVFNAWQFILDKQGVTEKQLRNRFKRLEDNQFENLKEQLLDTDNEPEDIVIVNDGKYIQQELLEDLQGMQDLDELDEMGFIKSATERLAETDPSYNQAKVRSLSKLQQRIPIEDRIAGEYTEGQQLTTVSGGRFSDLDLTARGPGLDITQSELDDILANAITLTDTDENGRVGDLAKSTVERLDINANTVAFWDRALRLSNNARFWYEVSAEGMRDVLPDLSDNEIKQFISVVAATSPVANPFVNMHRTIASYSNYLQGQPIDNDLVIAKAVTDALKTADLEGLKTGSFGGTMQLVLGLSSPTLSTNDRQVAATFNTDGEQIGKNPELYEVMSRFYIGLRDKVNADLPEGAQPYESWQLQALGWVEQRYKNDYVSAKVKEGMTEEQAVRAYETASPEEVAGGINDVDDYSMSLLRRDNSGRRDRKGAIQILEEAGIDVPGDKITKDILLNPAVPDALSPTTVDFRDKRTITAEINTLRNDIGTQAREIFDAAIEQGNQKVADEYHSIFATLLNKSAQGSTNPFTFYFKALGLSKAEAKPTRVATATGSSPLAVGGSYQGDVSPNIRIPVPASVTFDQLNVVMTSLAKQWDQDAVPATHMLSMSGGLKEGYTETSQVFVETLDELSRDQIESLANALPAGADINYTRYPNGYEFNILAFDLETFAPVTPDINEVATAVKALESVSGGEITAIRVHDAQWQSGGYSEIENYDEVFASFKESLYNEQASNLSGKVQRRKNGKVKDLTQKQIVAELKRKNRSEDISRQGRGQIERKLGIIQQQLDNFKQAESIAKSLASERDTKLQLYIQKNTKKVGLDSSAPTQAVSDAVDDIDEPSFIKKKQQNKELNKLDDGTPSTNKFTYNDEIDSQADLARRLKDSKIYRSLVDRYAPLEDFEQQAAEYLELGRLPAAISPRDQENLSHGRVQLDLDEFHEKHVDPIGDLIAELGYTVEAVDIYLIAKHAAERNDAIAEKVKEQRALNIQRTGNQIMRLEADLGVDHSVQIANLQAKLEEYKELPLAFQDTGSGMTYDEAQKVLDLAEQEGTQADMERIAEKVYEMLGEYRERMVTSGLLDEDTKADWEDRFEFYVPLKGFAAQDDGETYVRDATSRGFSVVGKESMKARGRKTLPFSPLLTSFEDVQKKIIRARKNEYANTLLDLLSELGNSESYTIYNTKFRPMKESDELTQQDLREMSLDVRPNGDPKYIEVKRDGQTFFIYFESDALNHTLQNMSVPMLSRANESMGKLLNLATRFQNFRRNMLINYNPTWGLVNPLRDVQTGLMYALAEMDKKGSRVKGENLIGKMAQSYLPAMRALYRNYRGKPAREGNEMDQFVVEYREDGAPTGMMLMKDADEQLRILKNKIKRGTVRDLLKGIGKFVEDFNTTMENSIRLAAYVEARKAGASREDAATLAKDLTVNFNRKGEDTAVINAGYLFFNAAVQGNMNILQAMADDGGKGSKKTTTARKAALGMVAIGSALALFNILSSEEDDDGELLYDDLPEHAKNRSLLFMWSKDEGFALPAPYGYNFFTNAGRLSTELALGINDEKETAQYLWENFLLNFVPVAPSAGDSWEDAARGFYPDLLEAHLDLLANKNFFGSDIYIEQNPLFVERSKAYNARRSTDKMFTVPAQFLNDLTGGDKYKDGWLAMNPDKVQYVYEYLLGGVGRFASQTTDVASRMIADEEYRKQDLPIVGAFFESPSEYEDRFEFYANWEETRKIVTRFKEATSADEIRQLQEEYKAYIPLLENRYGGKNMYELANRDLRRISKARKIIERQDYGSGADVEMKRRQMLEDLLASENKIFDIFNKAYREAERQ